MEVKLTVFYGRKGIGTLTHQMKHIEPRLSLSMMKQILFFRPGSEKYEYVPELEESERTV